jgi:threonine dehydratase
MTPLLTISHLGEDILLKSEYLKEAGSFKISGVCSFHKPPHQLFNNLYDWQLEALATEVKKPADSFISGALGRFMTGINWLWANCNR